MKTDIKALLTTVCSVTETLVQDRANLAMPKDAADAAVVEHNRVAGLLGHTISGLRGIEANLKGLLGEAGEPVARQPKKAPTPATQDSGLKTSDVN